MKHKYIDNFNPHVETLNRGHEDFLCKFHSENFAFDSFIRQEAFSYVNDGEGVTRLVFDKIDENHKNLIAFYTLAATSIPFISRIKINNNEGKIRGIRARFKKEYDEKICGISAIEIKMFAVDKNYQDMFYKMKEYDMPVSAWVFQSILNEIIGMSNESIGAKAVFLHSVREAEDFYRKNNLVFIEKNMVPLHSDDDELSAMYFRLPDKKIDMCYDK